LFPKKTSRHLSFCIHGPLIANGSVSGSSSKDTSSADDELYESIYEVIRPPSESDFEEIQELGETPKSKKVPSQTDRCYDFINIFAKKLAFFTPNKAKVCKDWIITLVFEKYAKLFA
jgi:hypothetical protein